jgi:hypothetical protein
MGVGITLGTSLLNRRMHFLRRSETSSVRWRTLSLSPAVFVSVRTQGHGRCAIVPHDASLLVKWSKVTGPILPRLGPVEIAGYHVLVVDVTVPVLPPGKTKTSFDADVSKDETSFVVPKQYLEPNRIYELEILATEKGGNQTITEGGVFCTPPIAPVNCKKP